ncbi:hypothetical protein VNO77_16816 [Canavalia gladiata]|uniref:Uncharacterized protein n=1 Tax=Canavalia gladiata TaxID=3824 RepID=A0AAN9LHU1_CANGL
MFVATAAILIDMKIYQFCANNRKFLNRLFLNAANWLSKITKQIMLVIGHLRFCNGRDRWKLQLPVGEEIDETDHLKLPMGKDINIEFFLESEQLC